MSRPPNVHSVAWHGRLSTCTVTAAAPLWNLAAVAMQLLDAMTCKRCVCCDAEDTHSAVSSVGTVVVVAQPNPSLCKQETFAVPRRRGEKCILLEIIPGQTPQAIRLVPSHSDPDNERWVQMAMAMDASTASTMSVDGASGGKLRCCCLHSHASR
jgi:hypothetical protein